MLTEFFLSSSVEYYVEEKKHKEYIKKCVDKNRNRWKSVSENMEIMYHFKPACNRMCCL